MQIESLMDGGKMMVIFYLLKNTQRCFRIISEIQSSHSISSDHVVVLLDIRPNLNLETALVSQKSLSRYAN